MKPPSRAWALAATLLLSGSLAACGSDSGTGSTPSSNAPAAPSTASSTTTGQKATVATASSGLGTILVDGKGMTLYLFTKDTQGAGTSTCEAQCLAAWPPLLGQPQAGTGADSSLLGTLTRSDGATQVTYNGWPLYYWAQDSAPGDTSGQGVSGVWWVVDPAGDAIGS
jgi:predicted lipoprotein with Yx(FWY)xxD motif